MSTCRTPRRIACLAACIAGLLAAGCGGSERQAIPRPTAQALAAQSDSVAAALERGDRCEADRLAAELVGEVGSAPLPAGYRTPLLDAARSLADRIDCPPRPPAPRVDEDEERGEGDNGHGGKGKGSGKEKGD